MILTQGSIPEVKEDVPGASIDERTRKLKTFQDLGPPDLVSLTKHIPGTKSPETGTFLYYRGLDNSSSSAVAAHLNQLANVIGATPQYWFGKHKAFKVSKATYSSYNAFSRLDFIVTVHIPGAVDSYIVDGLGEKIQETEKLWVEVYTSSVLRALLVSEDDTNAVVEVRSLNPFYTVELAKYFFDAFELLFFEGPSVGAAPEIQAPSLISNYLVDGFLKAVELTGLYDYALEILYRLREKEESVVSLIVRVLLLKDEEVQAFKTLHEGIKKNPRDASLLLLQSEILVEKGKLGLALTSAIQAVNSAPSEFYPWANLSKTYLELGDIEQSLLTLNACPMAAFKEKFHLRRIISAPTDQIHLPLPLDVHLEDVSSLDSSQVAEEHQTIDQALVNLQGANLKSTFAKSYEILTDIVHRVGWEALLKYRAKIFVMEEEYRSKSSSTTNVLETANGSATENGANSFKKKRLCERWLDNLFMLLYDDLKTYTMWQAELIHFQAQKNRYEKLPLEWEYLGLIAYRLHHYKEAASSFQRALELRFSPAATRGLLKYYQLEVKGLKQKATKAQRAALSQNGNENISSTVSLENSHLTPLQIARKQTLLDEKIIDIIVKLTAWNHRWYSEFAPYLLVSLSKIVEREGLVKIQNQIKANYPDESGVTELLEDSFQFLKIFNFFGAEI